ncbi:hypothetical protein GCM10010167_54990 [Paractinoplanes deccanensis]
MTPEQRRDAIVSAALPLVAEHGAAVTTAQIARAAGIGEATIFRVFDDKDALLQACIARALDPANVLSQLRSISLDQPLADRLVEAVDALDAHMGRIGAVIGALHASGMPNRRPRPGERGVRIGAGEPKYTNEGAGASAPEAVRGGGVGASAPEAVRGGGVGASAPEAVRGGGVGASAPEAVRGGGVGASAPEAASRGGAGTSDPEGASGSAAEPTNRSDHPQSGATPESREPTLLTARDEAQAATRQAVLELVEPDQADLRLPAEQVTDVFLGVLGGRGRGPALPAAEFVDLLLYGAVAR